MKGRPPKRLPGRAPCSLSAFRRDTPALVPRARRSTSTRPLPWRALHRSRRRCWRFLSETVRGANHADVEGNHVGLAYQQRIDLDLSDNGALGRELREVDGGA